MSDQKKKNIFRIRTFSDDIARARGQVVTDAPKVTSKKKSAQKLTDTLLKDTIDTRTTEDFIGTTDGEYIPMESDADLSPMVPIKKQKETRLQKTTQINTPDTNDSFSKKYAEDKIAHKNDRTDVDTKTSTDTNTEKKIRVPKKTFQKDASSLEQDVANITTKAEDIPQGTVFSIDADTAEEGTIITNKKKKRFRLLPSVGKAVTSWFSHKIENITLSDKPTQTITNAKSRIETIREAARTSNHAPTDDHGIILKTLQKKKVAHAKNPAVVSIKQKEQVAKPQWESLKYEKINHKKNIPSTTLNKRNTSVTSVQKVKAHNNTREEVPTVYEKQKMQHAQHHQVLQPSVQKTKKINEQHSIDTVKENKEIKDDTTPITQPGTPAIKDKNKIQTTQTHSTRETAIQKPKKIPKSKASKKIYEVPLSPTTVSQKTHTTYKSSAVPASSGIPIYIYIGVILFASLAGIGTSLYWFTSSTTQEKAVILRIPSLFTVDQKIAMDMPDNTQDFLSTLLYQMRTTRETAQIYPTYTNENNVQVPVPAKDILEVLNWRAPGSFLRSITDITFGSYDGNNPFILLKATNFETAFGGLLDWEPDMSADLSPLFGPVVTQSFDPYARTDTQIRSAFFRDTIIGNKSARILVDSLGNERLLYVFITPQVVLIAPNTETVTAIMSLVTQ